MPQPKKVARAAARDPRRPAGIRAVLLAWYAKSRRDLPWRRTRDPYAIWLSEAMLQQTRVETVEPYWARFLARFPTVAALAAARDEDVLALWSGLGYYRRARQLHAAARAIVDRHGGEFPRAGEAARALPGVGPYTAGAVLSIAFGAPEPLVDGNVARVLARLFAIEGEIDRAATKRELWRIAGELVPGDGRAGDWNQALMELGATVCTPRVPACPGCPLRRRCAARERGLEAELPRVRARPRALRVELLAAVARRGGALVLERRPEGARLAGLWQLPTIERVARSGGPARLFPQRFAGARFELREPLAEVRHAITRHAIRLTARSARPVGAVRAPCRWVGAGELPSLPLTGMTRKVLARLAAAGGGSPPK